MFGTNLEWKLEQPQHIWHLIMRNQITIHTVLTFSIYNGNSTTQFTHMFLNNTIPISHRTEYYSCQKVLATIIEPRHEISNNLTF